nr:Chain B, PEPTIDE MET-ARG-TYR-TYR-GLU-SER-SER-LEU-LYS-SER-TYR-PRO-ASP [unidentified]2BTX_B Chain B, LIBRARY DERIVED PEPTIDE [unidentified]
MRYYESSLKSYPD